MVVDLPVRSRNQNFKFRWRWLPHKCRSRALCPRHKYRMLDQIRFAAYLIYVWDSRVSYIVALYALLRRTEVHIPCRAYSRIADSHIPFTAKHAAFRPFYCKDCDEYIGSESVQDVTLKAEWIRHGFGIHKTSC